MFFLNTLSTEFIKTKNTFAVWLTILSAGFLPAFMFLVYLQHSAYLIPKPGENPWAAFFFMSWKGMAFMVSTFFIVLISCLIMNVEHKANGWKHLLTLPISKTKVYIQKMAIVMVFVVGFYLLYTAMLILSGLFVRLIKPKLGLSSSMPDFYHFFILVLKSLVSSLSILAIFF